MLQSRNNQQNFHTRSWNVWRWGVGTL